MYKQYLKQALAALRETPLVSCISILGTALSIAMVMVVVLLFQIKFTGYSPESGRGRMLYVYGTSARRIVENQGGNNGCMSARIVKECYYPLQTPEAVTAYATEMRPVSLGEKRLFEEYSIKYTDPAFWKVFDFAFTKGHPFTEADFHSALPVAVVTDRLAANLFGSEDPIGKSIVVNFADYNVVGVVKEVSKAAKDAYADLWIPYSASVLPKQELCEGVAGPFAVAMLARSSADFAAVRAELDSRIKAFNAGQKEYAVGLLGGGPISRLDYAMGNDGFNHQVSLKDYLLDTGALLLFLLIIPALNLVSIIQSSVQKRSSELGLRRAFGASRLKLITQVLSENMLVTLLGGVLGIMLSVVFFHVCKGFMLQPGVALETSILFKPIFFLSALFFAALLNLLSASLPAWRISRKEIVTALGEGK